MRTLLLTLLLIAVFAAIFMLAQQDVAGTQDLAYRVERLLARLVPPTGTGAIGEPTWCGLTIRRLAHIAEYALVGMVAEALAVTFWGAGVRSLCAALALCLAASFADEAHKLFVPGRHFDPADLVLDAAGYVPAALLTFIVGWLAR